MFKGIAAMIAFYLLYAVSQGQVHAKSGLHMTVVSREESPVYFWLVIGCYGIVGAMLLFIPGQ